MSAAVVAHPSFRHAWLELRQLVREAVALGATFRISGADIVIDTPESFPMRLRDRLQTYQESGWLWPDLGGERHDADALAFAAKLARLRGLGHFLRSRLNKNKGLD